MNKTNAIAITLLAATLSIGLPIWVAIQESQRQGLATETARVASYARDVMLRTDGTADQVARGFDLLERASAGAPCSDAAIALMRQIDLTSSYLQAIGYADHGRIVCSSLGRDTRGLLLGRPDTVTANGVAIHKQLRFPFPQQQSFIALERRNYVAIIHKDLPIDTTISEKDVSLAVFLLGDPLPLTSRGLINRDWMARLGKNREAVFVDGRHVVAVVRSKRYLSAAIAAVPIDYLDSRTREAAWRLVPTGVIAGLILAATVLLLARTQMAIPAAIRSGLKRKEFFLHYQPIIDLKSGALVGAEALIRWRRVADELIEPGMFIPMAEKNGLICQITQRVFDLVASDTGGFLERWPNFHVAINLSAADLHSGDLARQLASLQQQTRAAADNFFLEITERGLLDVDVARRVTRELRALGYRIAIDDFGTGYSSLSYLESLEVDYLKIDKSFIEAIATDAPTSQVVPHIIEMAKSLKLRMVAEGVETEAQAQFLRQHGVQFAQGWLFGRPMPFADLAQQYCQEAAAQALRAPSSSPGKPPTAAAS